MVTNGSQWTRKQVAAAAAFCAVAALQLLVPAAQLAAEHQPRFGWQMFSRFHAPLLVTTQSAGGVTDTIRWSDHFARYRPEIDVYSVLPPHLCAVLSDVRSVRLRTAARDVVFPCD